MLISNAVNVLTLKSSFWIPLTWKTFMYYALSMFFCSVWRRRFTSKSATIKIIREIPSLKPVTKKNSSIIHSDDISYYLIGIGLTQTVRKIVGFPIYFVEGAEENDPHSRRGGVQKRGSPCDCNGKTGTYWFPRCPSGWSFCWEIFPFTGECCIQKWVLHGRRNVSKIKKKEMNKLFKGLNRV